MDFLLSPKLKARSKVFLQKAGYHEFVDPNTGATSYIRRLGTEFYPRFHIYVQGDDPVRLSLHLDQKHVSYEGSHAHGGEYEGPQIEEEQNRLVQFAESGEPDRVNIMGTFESPPPSTEPPAKKSIHDKLGL